MEKLIYIIFLLVYKIMVFLKNNQAGSNSHITLRSIILARYCFQQVATVLCGKECCYVSKAYLSDSTPIEKYKYYNCYIYYKSYNIVVNLWQIQQ